MRAVPKQRYLLPIEIEELGDGRYLGRCSKLPGLNVQADSIEEVVKLAPKIARSLISAMRDKGVALPRGLTSARMPLRVQTGHQERIDDCKTIVVSG